MSWFCTPPVRKAIPIAAGIAVAAAVAAYALSPFFMETEIYEEMPQTIQTDPGSGVTAYGGTFVGVNDGIHNAEGSARALPRSDDGYVLRLENFYSTPGPDLYVYLSTDKGIDDHINLGSLKANRGDQNYEIPPGTDLDRYDHVLVWCKPFGVLFGSAQLQPSQ